MILFDSSLRTFPEDVSCTMRGNVPILMNNVKGAVCHSVNEVWVSPVRPTDLSGTSKKFSTLDADAKGQAI